jgi:hypothetical protein
MQLIDTTEYSLIESFHFERKPEEARFIEDDVIVFLIDQKIAAIGRCESRSFSFTHLFLKENRPVYTPLVNLDVLLNDPNDDFGYFINNSETLYEEAKDERKREIKHYQKKEKGLYPAKSNIDWTLHTETQFILKEIASICHMDHWVAANDKNRQYKTHVLNEEDIEFPFFDLDKKAQQQIALIDNIWFKGSYPQFLFEVETTNNMHSALLRMADCLATVTLRDTSFFIVAPKNRQTKFLREISRPSFKVLGIQDQCGFIPIEELKILYEKIKGLDGYIQPDVINKVAYRPLKEGLYV